MRANEKAARLAPNAARNDACEQHFTDRLARTKALLIEAYAFGALPFRDAEGIAARMRRRFPYSWRCA